MWNGVMWGLLALVASGAVYGWMLHRRGRRLLNFRRLYWQQMARLEQLVAELNHYGHLLGTLPWRDESLMDRYESALRRVEALLRSLHKLPGFHSERRILIQIEPMISSCEELVASFKGDLRRKAPDGQVSSTSMQDWLEGLRIPARGCFFCSRPFLPRSFKRVRLTYKGAPQRVWACHVCRSELKSRGELAILHFRRPEGVLHWSECPDYDPILHFGNLDQHRLRHLRPPSQLLKDDNDERSTPPSL
jgi:hypothetical protein